jgi:hypothetical protein
MLKYLSFRSKEDSILRAEIESEIQYTEWTQEEIAVIENRGVSHFFFFPPLNGLITSHFNAAQNHYGIDIVADLGTPIKATLDGTVILHPGHLPQVIPLEYSMPIILCLYISTMMFCLKVKEAMLKQGKPFQLLETVEPCLPELISILNSGLMAIRSIRLIILYSNYPNLSHSFTKKI